MKNTTNAFSVLFATHRAATVPIIAFLLLVATIGAKAQTYNLSVADSSIQVNLTSGLSDWMTSGGPNQLGLQTFYYSIGSDEFPIQSISSAGTPSFTGAAFGGRILNTNITVTYENSALSLTTAYTLSVQGGGATLATTLSIQNVSTTNETVDLYQYSDFTLGGIAGGQSVQFLQTANPYAILQTGNGGILSGSLNVVGLGIPITVGEMAGTGALGLGNGNANPPFNDSSLSATGSVAYGYEFTATLTPDSSISISELQTVPEPSSVALVSSGLIGLGLLRKRGFKK